MPDSVSGLTTSHPDKRDGLGSLRVGVRVPVAVSTATEPNNIQFVDVGTKIDCWVWQWTEDRYLVTGTVEFSSVYAKNSVGETTEVSPGEANLGSDPLIRQTRGDFSIALHDGQSGEPMSLTDPITGHLFKLEVTLNLVK